MLFAPAEEDRGARDRGLVQALPFCIFSPLPLPPFPRGDGPLFSCHARVWWLLPEHADSSLPSPCRWRGSRIVTVLPLLRRLSGLSPFLGETDAETMNFIVNCSWDFDADTFEGLSEEAKDFVSRLLVKEKR